MTGFWIAGAAINLVFFGALVWWALRNWKRGAPPPTDRDDAG